MLPPTLRTAAARFALGIADVADLMDAAHVCLDRGIYTDGLAVIATTPGMPMADLAPLFTTGLAELGVSLPSPADAFRRLQLHQLQPILECTTSPQEGVELYYRRFHEPFGVLRHAVVNSWEDDCSSELANHREGWEGRGYLFPYEPGGNAAAVAAWQAEAVALARKWCAELGRGIVRPEWRSPTVNALASGIDAKKAFDRLPILADALEDAGCDDLDLLDHCREGSPHVAECWVVNLLLNK